MLNQRVTMENGKRVEAVGISDPPGPARRDSREPPAYVVTPAQISLFGNEQPQKRAGDVAHADDGEIVGRHWPFLREEAGETDNYVCPTL
jgi:hypothetical protein